MSLQLKYRVLTGENFKSLIPEAFALVAEASYRVFGYRHHNVQLIAGIQLFKCKIAEMKTGEGKTLTATLPTFLHALAGKGAHVATVNDYLAARDWETMKPIYDVLGVSSSVIKASDTPSARFKAYRKDITYFSVKELGFDFLRDRMSSKYQNVVPPLYFCLIDEADSILMDEARTPLIIGIHDSDDKELMDGCYRWAATEANQFIESRDFVYNKIQQKVDLTYQGRSKVGSLPQNEQTRLIPLRQLCEIVQKAIKVEMDIVKGTQYDIIDKQVVIIDEYTGRPAEGRQWQDGIHQIVEAKENLEISAPTKAAAMITIQDLFSRYPKMAGMTGTATTARREFRKAYKKSVVAIPCHRPVDRLQLQTRIFETSTQKIKAIIDEVKTHLSEGRAILIGTRSVDFSEIVSSALTENDITHSVLNSRNLEMEADIVAQAGTPNAVTVATNMAGRGTDIKLHPDVRTQGGLHVILSEIHDSSRVDWQLIGRGARQGDPGSFRIFLSAEDEILSLGSTDLRPIVASMLKRKLPTNRVFAKFITAQRSIERKHLVDRLMLLRQNNERYRLLADTGQDPLLI